MPLYLIIGKMIKYYYKKGDNLETKDTDSSEHIRKSI
jgi:hypothetical protein